MACLFRWQGLSKDTNDVRAAPGVTGYGDIGSAVSGSQVGNNTAVARMDVAEATMNNGRKFATIKFYDSVLGDDTNFWKILPSATPDPAPATYTGPWSMRMYVKIPANIADMTFLHVKTGTTVNFGFVKINSTNRITRSATGEFATLPNNNWFYRLEIQCDPARTSTLVWRLYMEDQTTAIAGYASSPTSVSWDNMLIGSLSSGLFASAQQEWGEIEIHDDYDLGGKFRSNPQNGVTPASTTAEGAPSWSEGIHSRYRPNLSNYTTIAAGTPSFDSYLNVNYATNPGVYGRKFDLYVPQGTPPAGGWPLLCWAHSGFFVSGSKNDLPVNWRNDMLLAGYAVASIQYVKTSLDLNTGDGYDAYGFSEIGGRYPSFIVDYKRAAAFLRDNAAAGPWALLNTAKFFATGFSAGGYIALAAAMTRGLATDSAGTPLTIAGATAAGSEWGDTYTLADPIFAGSYVYHAPVDMDLANSWDPSYPFAGSVIRRSSYRFFQGLASDLTAEAPAYPRQSIASHIGLNSVGNLCPVAYERGTGDYLVHWKHEEALATALAAKGVSYTEIVTPNMHDKANSLYAREDILGWLNPIAYPEVPVETKSLFYHNGSTSTVVDEDYHDGSVVPKQLYSR